MSNYTKATNFASKDALPTGNALKTLSGTEIDDEFSNIQTAVATKANSSNAAFTGIPVAPTAATATNTTQVATTAFSQAAITAGVTSGITAKANLASPALTGTPTAPTAATATNTTQLATTAYVQANAALRAPLVSPTLTGVPTAPTAASGTNTTQLATTAYTTTAISAIPAVTAAVVNALAYPVGAIYTSTVSTNPATTLGVGTWAAFGAGRVLLGNGGGYGAGATGGATTDSHTLTVAEMPSHVHGYTGVQGTGNPDGSTDSTTAGNTVSYPRVTELDYEGGGQAHTHDIMQPYIVVYFWKRTA